MKKMKTITTSYIVLTLVVMGFTIVSCKKELSVLPKNAKVDANTILDQPTAQIALNGAYYCFANATNVKTGWQNHEIRPAFFTGFLQDPNNSDNNEPENRYARITSYYWAESYTLLNAVNGVIKGVNTVPDSKFTNTRKKEIIAEAHFLRAYGHFKILSYYAEWFKPGSKLGVLLRDELSTISNIAKARSTVKESYDFILADLDDAIANAPAVNQNVYATKWAGMALKMRVLMSRAQPSDYAEVISLADNIMKNSPYILEPKAEDIFHKSGLASKEVILGIKPQTNQQLDYYSKSAQYWPGASSLYLATSGLKNLLNNDPRQNWMLGTVATRFPNNYYFTKYIVQGSTPSVVSETDYALRLTEVYLLKAEAIARSGGNLADAKALIHTIQSKAGITAADNNTSYLAVENAATADALLLELYKENVKSLMAEDGLEWLALLRFSFETVRQLKPTITSQSQYILPIPRDEFMYNPSFGDQNPGYDKN